MKRYILLVIIVIINASFIEIPKRYWQASCSVRMRPTMATVVINVIEADTKDKADKIFRKYIKSCTDLKGGVIETGGDRLSYDISEIKNDDILK